jgi:hypothetical protein
MMLPSLFPAQTYGFPAFHMHSSVALLRNLPT